MCEQKSTMADNSPLFPCPNHPIHQHKFLELGLDSSSNQQPYFRAMIFFNKKPGLTDEFFHDHWKSIHADLTMQVEDAGVSFVRYVQFHQEQKHRDALAPLLGASGGSMVMSPYDGAAEFHAESAGKFVEFMKSVYASKHLVGCGSRFVDLEKGYHVMGGYDNLIFGPGLPGVGKDGIMAGDSRLNVRVRDKSGGVLGVRRP
ncbi:hypothetical protein GQ44DRAFT_130319 [Phaeosphaeriaceae sp. PMI808]|nr:hypothetical protein GQ44DRAFT_130319 [Phaeosphaeriaceae sp. PMI808]